MAGALSAPPAGSAPDLPRHLLMPTRSGRPGHHRPGSGGAVSWAALPHRWPPPARPPLRGQTVDGMTPLRSRLPIRIIKRLLRMGVPIPPKILLTFARGWPANLTRHQSGCPSTAAAATCSPPSARSTGCAISEWRAKRFSPAVVVMRRSVPSNCHLKQPDPSCKDSWRLT
jgi:hypothetical protein